MGSLRTLRSSSRQDTINLNNKVFTSFYNLLEHWKENYPKDFIVVMGELNQGSDGDSYYCLRDSLQEYYGMYIAWEEFHTEAQAILIDLWENRWT